MKVFKLRSNPDHYSCNAYLVLGEWSTIEDVNTLIDIGTDGFIINEIEEIYTGVGKKKIEKVLITHTHFDHVGGLSDIKKLYNPEVYAQNHIQDIDVKLFDGQIIRIGDSECVAIHTPGHSYDSFCFYCESEQILFAGDTQINIRTAGGTYTQDFVKSLQKISDLKIKKIYHGHDEPLFDNISEILEMTMKNVKQSSII